MDAVRSTPQGQDLYAMQCQTDQNGQRMNLVFRDTPYTVLTGETLDEDTGQLHHWELGICEVVPWL